MIVICSVTFLLLAAWLGFHVYWTWILDAGARAVTPPAPEGVRLPRVAVILPLRGADPFLERCLAGLFAQDYPSFEIRIVIDSADDPAWDVVRASIARHRARNVWVEVLENRRRSCSLKLSSLIQAASGISKSVEAIVLIDADAVPHANWLHDLTAPFRDPSVAVASGVRWYMPDSRNPGTLVRYLWNACSILQMEAFGIGWGGSLAIRTSLVRDANLLEKWSRILVEDVISAPEAKKLGRRLVFVGAATMINREFIDLKSCLRFITRQLVSVKLYHPRWPVIVALGIVSSMATGVAVALLPAALVMQQWDLAAAVGAGLATYALGFAALLGWREQGIRSLLRRRGERAPALSLHLVWAGVLTQFFYIGCLVTALRMRAVQWRGVTYRLDAPTQIRMVKYRPYRAARDEAGIPLSL